MATTLSVVSVADEVPEIVWVPLMVLVPVPETVMAVGLRVLSVTDEVPEIVRLPVTVLVQVRRQVWRRY